MRAVAIVLGLCGLLVIGLVVAPLSAIWAVNTLFGTGIPYNVSTWFASLLLVMFFGAKVSYSSKST